MPHGQSRRIPAPPYLAVLIVVSLDDTATAHGPATTASSWPGRGRPVTPLPRLAAARDTPPTLLAVINARTGPCGLLPHPAQGKDDLMTIADWAPRHVRPLRGHQARARRAIRMPRRARRPAGDRVRTAHRAGRRTSCRRGAAARADGARSDTGAGGYGRRPHSARLCCRAARVGRPLPPGARRRPCTGPAHQRRGREHRLPRSD